MHCCLFHFVTGQLNVGTEDATVEIQREGQCEASHCKAQTVRPRGWQLQLERYMESSQNS
jgi:hypothetical protein